MLLFAERQVYCVKNQKGRLLIGLILMILAAGHSLICFAKRVDGPFVGGIRVGRVKALEKYDKDDKVCQVMLVKCSNEGNASAHFYVRDQASDRNWSLVFSTDAFIGWNGTGKTIEGDGKSPLGDFGIRQAFGILDNPGTSLEYIKITDSTACCSDNCEFYNQIIDKVETGHFCSGSMISHDPELHYGIATDYNHDNEWPKGSGIFIHCKGEKEYTEGCIAIDEELMKKVLLFAEPDMRIIIQNEGGPGER